MPTIELLYIFMSFIGASDGEVPAAGKRVVAGVLKHIKFSYIFAGLLMRG